MPEGFEHFFDGMTHMLERVVRRLPAAMAVVAVQGGVAVFAGGVSAVDRAHGQWAKRRLKAPTIANFQDSFRFVLGCYRACVRRSNASTHGVDLLMDLEEQAPLLRGCPDRGGEKAGKGRGPNVAQQRLGRSARSALRVPRQITEKGCPFRQPFSVIWRREGDCRVHPCTRSRRAAHRAPPAAVRFCSCRTVEPRRGFSRPMLSAR